MMKNLKRLLSENFSQREDKFSKMDKFARESSYEEPLAFSGLFKTTHLTEKERFFLQQLLEKFKDADHPIEEDLELLSLITTEVKAIHNQSVILHGERIKKAGELLKRYQDGAFSAWLMATYGNRQTPYNFLQYYLLYESLPQDLKDKITRMPKQAVYTLASREGDDTLKRKIIHDYQGETKNELLATIREYFPLKQDDHRKQNLSLCSITELSKLVVLMSKKSFKPSPSEKETLQSLLKQIQAMVSNV